ncbi:uncharacterized protein [Watersipora subatra]|uniref:uncharacterized protein n=1 Tax=Watersipora subatra TaxID=2589382 RepID=UPI00355BDF34
MKQFYLLIFHTICLVSEKSSIFADSSSSTKAPLSKDAISEENGIKFGEQGSSLEHVLTVGNGISMSTKSFFTKYVHSQQPVIFKQAIKSSPAYNLWSDNYFLQLDDIPKDHDVLVESRKKENRSAPPVRMPFKEFVSIYNVTDQYMVEPIPPFLLKDFILPHHLQCQQLMRDIIVEAFMWFSSGGTSSVVHTDSVENMNCLVAGKKRFIFVSPQQSDLVPIDHPEGAYSGIDVDNVDLSKYPGVPQVDFLYADVEAGDCLYIPFKWIHQVRSYDRNIAVNIWWDTFRNSELNLDVCDSAFDPDWSLNRVEFTGFQGLDGSPAIVRDHITDIMKSESSDFDSFVIKLGVQLLDEEEFQQTEEYDEIIAVAKQMFSILDVDQDGRASRNDLEMLSDDHWNVIGYNFNLIRSMVDEILEADGEEIGAGQEPHDEL